MSGAPSKTSLGLGSLPKGAAEWFRLLLILAALTVAVAAAIAPMVFLLRRMGVG